MGFGEMIPGPSYPGIDHTAPSILTKQYPGEVQASGVLSSGVVAYGKSGDGTQTYQTYRNLLGKISSGVVVLATATGYVNIS